MLPATESQVASRVLRVSTRARYPRVLPSPSMTRMATMKMPAAISGSSALPGWGEKNRVRGGAIRAPTTAPTTSPIMASPPQVKPRRYPEKERARIRSTIRASRMSIRSGV